MATTDAHLFQAANKGTMIDIQEGECRSLLRDITPKTIDCVVTSPPFWEGADQGDPWDNGAIGGETNPAAYIKAMIDMFAAVRQTLTPTGTVWLVLGEGKGTHQVKMPWAVINNLANDGWHIASATAWDNVVVTHLRLFQRGGDGCPVPPYAGSITDRSYAPLSRTFVRFCLNYSTLPNDIILDPCCGSGTVGIVSAEMKRHFIGIELDKMSAELAKARIERYTDYNGYKKAP
jgi:site-specific DNA-methyltransferase (cytosine-N4-specific)